MSLGPLALWGLLLGDCGKRLVEKEDVGTDHQRPGETHPLAHAAGKLVRIAVLEPGEPDLGNVPPRGLLPLLARDAAQLEPECDVAEDGRPGHQGEILDDEGALRTRPRDLAPVHQPPAGGGAEQTADELEQPNGSA